MPENTLNQYVLSMANRDPELFPSPDVFDPSRKELDMALTWNGAFGTPNDEKVYPRICPGRYLALDVSLAILPLDRARTKISLLRGHVAGIKEWIKRKRRKMIAGSLHHQWSCAMR